MKFTGDRLVMVDELAAALPLNFLNGLLLDADGRLVVTTVDGVANFLNGLPHSLSGALCVVVE